jgi:hypothetical protein
LLTTANPDSNSRGVTCAGVYVRNLPVGQDAVSITVNHR